MSTCIRRRRIITFAALACLALSLLAGLVGPASAEFVAQPCSLNFATTPVSYSCVIAQENPPLSVTLVTKLSADEAAAAAANPSTFTIASGKRPFSVSVSDAKGKVSIVKVTIRTGSGSPVEKAVAGGATEITDVEVELGGGRPVIFTVDGLLPANNIPNDGTEVVVPGLAVGKPANNPLPVAPPPVVPEDPIRNLSVSLDSVQDGFAEVGTPVVVGALFEGTGTGPTTYQWTVNVPSPKSTTALLEVPSTKTGAVSGTVRVKSGATTLKRAFDYRIVQPVRWSAKGPKALTAGKQGTWTVSNLRGGVAPYRASWVVNGRERTASESYKQVISRAGTYKFELRLFDQGRYRTTPKRLAAFDVVVTGSCDPQIRKFGGTAGLAAQLEDLDDPTDCEEVATAPVPGSGTGWYWMDFNAARGSVVDMAPNRSGGSYRIAVGYKFASDGRPQLVGPVGQGVGTLQLGFKGGKTCSWSWGSVRGPSCTVSPGGGSVTNDAGVTTTYRLERMSRSDARTTKAGLGGRTDFDAPDQI